MVIFFRFYKNINLNYIFFVLKMNSKIRFYKKPKTDITNFYTVFSECAYQGMRSNIIHGINPNMPPKNIIVSKNNYYGEKLDLQALIRNSFPLEAFNNNLILYITAPAKTFEETINFIKVKWIASLDIDSSLTALSYVYNNLQKNGSAIICCMTTDWENKGILEVLSHSFTTLKVSDTFIIAEKFNGKYSDNMLSYIKYSFDSNYSVKLLI